MPNVDGVGSSAHAPAPGQPAVTTAHETNRLRGEVAFRLLVEAVADYAIFLIDPTGHVLTWNPGAERIKGYRSSEIVGQHFSRFYGPEDREADRPGHLLAIAARDGRVEDEGWRVRKDGTRFWADVAITALRDEAGQPYAFAKVTRDLTERRAAEERERQLLVEQRARAVAEDSLRARDRFLSIASHELRTPVASLQLAVEALGRAQSAGRLDEARLERSLARMANSTQRLASLMDELLNVSRLTTEAGELTLVPTDLTQLTAEVIARFHDAAATRVRLEGPPSLVVPGDASRLDQVITNLVDNALKYSSAPAEVLVTLADRPDGALISVTDAGIGIGAGGDQLFAAFGRGDNAEHVQGLGLGLFICHSIVQRHGGTIAIVGRDDGPGATVRVWLPRPGTAT
jgi:PAS domain S-box-containing protein